MELRSFLWNWGGFIFNIDLLWKMGVVDFEVFEWVDLWLLDGWILR